MQECGNKETHSRTFRTWYKKCGFCWENAMPGFLFQPVCWFDIGKESKDMGRRKRYPEAENIISTFYAAVSDSYRNPSSEEVGDIRGRKKQELLADEFGISRLKVRKILITTGDVVYSITRSIEEMLATGKTKQEAAKALNIAMATLNSYLPYEKGVYKLADVSNYAENSRLYRERKAAVAELDDVIKNNRDISSMLWKAVCYFQNYTFQTSGRGSRPGVKFKYVVSSTTGASGKHYEGADVAGFGNELWIITGGEKREKSITRSSVDYALKVVLESRKRGEPVSGPKQLKIYGSSYVWAIFRRFGVM